MKTNNITNYLRRRSQATDVATAALGACFLIIAASAGTNVCRAAPDRGVGIGRVHHDSSRGTTVCRVAPDREDKLIVGETTEIAGGTAATWARVNRGGKVIWVGLTIPLSMVENMPPRGTGPAGAVAVLNYPTVVQETTYFNHAEIHSALHGHEAGPQYADPHRYEAPHFDFHFYGIPVADVWTIPPGLFPFANVPVDRLPVGYSQPAAFSIPQMGRHAVLLSEFAATDPWLLTMIAGFLPDASAMHFIEPMITRELLLQRQNFTLPVPMPALLGKATQYPTECIVHYDKEADAYHIVFKGFEPIE